ncbi:MAG TPA: hypothetical protein VNA13_00420 [Xanthomonadales bacterium]|nr:hypothetical protein [Xanthomonadales bacterium]
MPEIFNSKINKESIPVTPTVAKQSNPIGLFSAYSDNPTGINFANQEPNENIVLFLRRHFITNVGWIFFTVIFLLLPPILTALVSFSGASFFTITPQLMLVLTIFYYLLVFNYAFVKFITWFYHVGIVTPKRLLDLDVDNILHYHLAETGIEDVVDVSYSQKGFFQSFFNYGDVPIQTEAIKANFEFEKTPHPSEVADITTDLRPKQSKGGATHA